MKIGWNISQKEMNLIINILESYTCNIKAPTKLRKNAEQLIKLYKNHIKQKSDVDNN